MAMIEYGNVTARVSGISEDMMYALADKFSYTLGGFGKKPETHLLINPKNGIGYTGIVPRIVLFLKKNGISVQLVDKRVKPVSNASYALVDGFALRDYQREIVDNAKSRTCVQSCTGSGKTMMMAGLIVKFACKPAIIVSPDATLAFQIRDEIAKFLGVKVGIYTGTMKDVQDITVVTPQSALKADSLLENAKVILFDEAHGLGADSVFECARRARNAYYRVALSGSLWRDTNDDMRIEAAITTRKGLKEVTASQLTEIGKLAPARFHFLVNNNSMDMGYKGTYNNTYEDFIVNNNERNNLCRWAIRDAMKNNNGAILILFNYISHGEALFEIAKEEIGYTEFSYQYEGNTYRLGNVCMIDGSDDMNYRRAVLQATREQKVQILVGSRIADKGLDCPPLGNLITMGGGMSTTTLFQRIGRVIRQFGENKIAHIYDIMDMHITFIRHSMTRMLLVQKKESAWTNHIEIRDVENNKTYNVDEWMKYVEDVDFAA